MSLLVFGSTALDSISTPKKKNPRLLGGSGSHAAVAASFFVSPKLIGVVGTDFPRKYMTLFEKHKVNLKGVKVREGRTFHWAGEYEVNMNNRRTLSTELGVVEGYSPVLPAAHRKAKYVLLANNPPGAQEAIIDQLDKPKFIVADTMDLWMNVAMDDLRSLLKRVDMLVLNDSEARQLTGDDNVVSALPKLHKFGPRYVIVKKGEHGAILSSKKGLFVAPAFPLEKVEDPTGAGDSFVGAMVGYLAKTGGSIDVNIRKAILYGSVVASFCCEGFGLNRTTKTTRTEINKRLRELEKITRVGGAITVDVLSPARRGDRGRLGQPSLPCQSPNSPRASSTSLAWSATLTLGQTFWTTPSALMRKVIRLMPRKVRPMNDLLPHTP